jgi:type IV secretion system protein VirB10
MFRLNLATCLLLFMVVPGAALAQSVLSPHQAKLAPAAGTAPGLFDGGPAPALQIAGMHAPPPQILFENAPPPVAPAATPSAVTIPAGTRVLMVLKSPLHTTSGTAGSGIYLETLYPVIQGNKVVIPAHTFVQGVVAGDRRPGHLRRTSEFRFRFTDMVFSNNYVAPIQGVLQSIAGAPNVRTRDKEGTLETVNQTEKVVTPAAAGAVGGAVLGSERRTGIGKFTGAGLGAALGLGAVLLHRGDEISLAKGTNIEMIFAAPLTLEAEQVAVNARYVAPPATFSAAEPPVADDNNRKRRSRPYHPGLGGLLLGGYLHR